MMAREEGEEHLPGMMSSQTTFPGMWVPDKSSNYIDGWDSVLSILQMPSGVPVATVALNGAKNAGILALQILSTNDSDLQYKLIDYKNKLNEEVQEKARKIKPL